MSPRGFCAGVARSIATVEQALEVYGAPIYIKHAIVHNTTVVADLARKGAVTVDDVADIPIGATAVFSAHGSPPEHFAAARARGIRVIDATCPLVTKVHNEMRTFVRQGTPVIYIGHKNHVEGQGVIGEARDLGVEVPIVESVADVATVPYPPSATVAVLTQTTLSVEETADIVAAITKRYAHVVQPAAQDICYATTNRQKAVRGLAEHVDVVIVVGSVTSSNSQRLREVAETAGCAAYLVDHAGELRDAWFAATRRVGVSAGASAPEYRVKEVVAYFTDRGARAREMVVVDERVRFTLPPITEK